MEVIKVNERLMMSEEECRKKVKELLQIPKEDLLIKYMFQEQEIERLKEDNFLIKSANKLVSDKRKCIDKCKNDNIYQLQIKM